ncbi:hypothetical protein, partial [Shigella boydii]|uniref:hypothetical protein n=1 Tax=Shigella boydii TaxID=621 RepID=UPI003CEF05AE
SDGNGSHASTLKSPSYTKSVSWQHYLHKGVPNEVWVHCFGYTPYSKFGYSQNAKTNRHADPRMD